MVSLSNSIGLLSLVLTVILCGSQPLCAQRQLENLTRGTVAVKQDDGRVFVGWRFLGTDPEAIAFNLYRITAGGQPVKVNRAPIRDRTNFTDGDADPARVLEYYVRPVLDGKELEPSKPIRAWETNYLAIPIQPISGYRPGDASIADLDGDGEYEIVLHQTSRGRDNAFAGITGTPVLDGYELDGTHLWRIDLGINIREGNITPSSWCMISTAMAGPNWPARPRTARPTEAAA